MTVRDRLREALRTLPTASDWRDLGIAAGILAIAAALGSSSLLEYAPRHPLDIVPLASRAFFIPAFGEELVFRAALVPGRGEGTPPAGAVALSTLLFTLWHVVETTFLPGSAATFLRADFLALAAALGALCAILRWRSGSIWPAVVLHWIVVVAWQGWFGGPSFGIPN